MLETYSEFEPDSTPQKFENVLSGYGTNPTGSMTESYNEMSHGRLQLDIDVYGPYTSVPSQAYRCYYGTEGSIVGGEQLGLGGGGAKGMAAEAVPQADADVDFGQYDNDNDGWVDFLMILHSGPDAAATGDPCMTWSHMFPQIVGEPAAATTDVNAEGEPVMIGNTMTVPEIGLEIGVAAHETMHSLGEPDYYATNYKSAGTGDWDLGAGGSWYGDPPGSSPLHFNPMVKMNQKWIEPRVIEGTTLGAALRPREKFPDLILVPTKFEDDLALCELGQFGYENITASFKIGDRCAVEGFLLEHVSRSVPGAIFDRYALGSGVLAWHYDLTKWSQGGNDDFLRPMLDLLEFDRRDDSQDLQLNKTRGDPMDAFFGDPVGISTATADLGEVSGTPQPSQEFTVAAPPSGGSTSLLAGTPIPEWDVENNPANRIMRVTLDWGGEKSDANDWDLYLYRQLPDGSYTEVSHAAGGGSAHPEVVSLPFPAAGHYRVEAYNWLSHEATATVKVEFLNDAVPILQTSNTLSNDMEVTGWSFTNFRPSAYSGLEVPSEHGDHTITLDLVRHDGQTIDLSPEFVRVGEPLQAGRKADLSTTVYQHGGATVPAGTAVKVTLGSPKGKTVARGTLGELPGFSQTELDFTWTPARPGKYTLWSRVVPPAGANDLVTGNNTVPTRVEVFRSDAKVLIVDDDDGFPAEEAFTGALEALGIPYAISENTASAPLMSRFDAVIWHTANSRYEGQLDPTDRDAARKYLEAGGRLWLAGPNAARALDADDPISGGQDPQFLHDYFGVNYVDSMQSGAGRAIGTGDKVGDDMIYRLDIPYARPLMDYVELGNEEEETASTLGTASAVFRWEPIEDSLVGAKVVGAKDAGAFRTVFTTFDVGQVINGEKRVTLVENVLSWFGVQSGEPSSKLRIRHAAIRAGNLGMEKVLNAYVGGSPSRVLLYTRPHLGGAWKAVKMRPVGAGHYSSTVTLPSGGLDYYIVARAGRKTAAHPNGAPTFLHFLAARS